MRQSVADVNVGQAKAVGDTQTQQCKLRQTRQHVKAPQTKKHQKTDLQKTSCPNFHSCNGVPSNFSTPCSNKRYKQNLHATQRKNLTAAVSKWFHCFMPTQSQCWHLLTANTVGMVDNDAACLAVKTETVFPLASPRWLTVTIPRLPLKTLYKTVIHIGPLRNN